MKRAARSLLIGVVALLLCCSCALKRPPTHEAAIRGDRAAVVRALDAGESPDLEDSNGDTTILAALIGRNFDIAELLLRRGANVNHVNRNGLTPYDLVRNDPDRKGNEARLVWLRKHGGDSVVNLRR